MMGRAADDIGAVAHDVTDYTRSVVRDTARRFQTAIRAELERDTGGDFRLSGAPWAGKLAVKITTKVDKLTGAVRGKVTAGPKRALGPWRWLNDGTRPHLVNGRRHPGTRPKHTWDDPRDRIRPNAIVAAEQQFDRMVG